MVNRFSTKKISLIIGFFIIFHTIQSQIPKSIWIAEGNLGNINFYNTQYKTSYQSGKELEQHFSFYLNPKLGYVLRKNLIIGTTFFSRFYTSNRRFINSDGDLRLTHEHSWISLGIGSFLRYYFFEKNRIAVYSQIEILYIDDLFNKQYSEYFILPGEISRTHTANTNNNALIGDLVIGNNYFLNSRVAINTNLGYIFQKNNWSAVSFEVKNGIESEPFYSKFHYFSYQFIWNFGFTLFLK